MNKWGPLVIGAVFLAGAAFLILSFLRNSELQKENGRLRQQLDLLNRESEGQEPSNVLARSTDSLSEEDHRELLKLRSEVGLLRQQSNTLPRLQQENERLRASASGAASPSNSSPHFIAREQWEFRGYATPEDALGSVLWAAREVDVGAFLASLTPEMTAAMQHLTEEQIALGGSQELEKLRSYRIVKSHPVGEDEAILTVSFDGANREVRLRRINEQWRLAGPIGSSSNRPVTGETGISP